MIVYGQKWVICTYSEKDKIKGQTGGTRDPVKCIIVTHPLKFSRVRDNDIPDAL